MLSKDQLLIRIVLLGLANSEVSAACLLLSARGLAVEQLADCHAFQSQDFERHGNPLRYATRPPSISGVRSWKHKMLLHPAPPAPPQ